MILTYSELIKLPTFKERYEYLRLGGKVGKLTFGFDRYLNQIFYRSQEWKRVRNEVIIRDEGNDLAMPGYELHEKIYVHHMNPLLVEDIVDRTEYLLNPEFLITTCKRTHDAIHYGDGTNIPLELVERSKNDTCPWKK